MLLSDGQKCQRMRSNISGTSGPIFSRDAFHRVPKISHFVRRAAEKLMGTRWNSSPRDFDFARSQVRACLNNPPRIRGLGFGVPPLGGSSVLPPKGGTPNRVSKHALRVRA